MSLQTPYSELLDEGIYEIVMPSNTVVGSDTYNFLEWENGSTNPQRTISLTADLAISAVYQIQQVIEAAIEVHAFYDEIEVVAPYEIVGVGTGDTPAVVQVPPGTYTVKVTYGGKTLTEQATVSASQTLRLDFQFTSTPPRPSMLPYALGAGLIFAGIIYAGTRKK